MNSLDYLGLLRQLLPEAALVSTRAQLGQAAFAAAWDQGRAMSLEPALAYALEASDG